MSDKHGNNNHVLLPIDPITQHILSVRTPLIIDSLIVYLGGNDGTEILDPVLEKKIVKVYKKNSNGKVYAFACWTHNCNNNALINGTPLLRGMRQELHNGDTISIYNADSMEYRYRLTKAANNNPLAATTTTTACAAAVASAKATVGAATTLQRKAATVVAPFPPQLAENIICAVCMEVLLHPKTMVPCGHSFCKDCATPLVDCANCRAPIQSQITCLSLQNLVEQMVDISATTPYGMIENDDLQHYHDRKRAADAMSARNLAPKKRQRGAQEQIAVTRLAPNDFV